MDAAVGIPPPTLSPFFLPHAGKGPLLDLDSFVSLCFWSSCLEKARTSCADADTAPWLESRGRPIPFD